MSNSPRRKRAPVYFLSIGGPSSIEDTAHPAFAQLSAVGKEITITVKPEAVVIFSAHWQSGPSRIEVNVSKDAGIIYDFYGFPPHFYEYQYPYKGSPEVAERVIKKLTEANIETKRVKRGLDHGIWAGFMTAFNPTTNPLNVPIVQVSLYGNGDWDQHYRMGAALQALRDEGVLIMGTGMAVHNLHDFRQAMATEKTMPYAYSFDAALKDAATSDAATRQGLMNSLMKRKDARQAHPTLEHILPIYICAGAAGSDAGEQLWTLPEGSLSWTQYRFGEL